MRYFLLLLFVGLTGCHGPTPFEPDARDPASAVFRPAKPDTLGARMQPEGTVLLTWNDRSDHEDGYLLERRTTAEADFTVLATLPAGTATYLDTPPLTFGVTYRVSAFADRSGTRRLSEARTSSRVAFLDAAAYAPTLHLRDERALQLSFPEQLPDGFTLHLQRYADGQPDGPARTVQGPLEWLPTGRWPYENRMPGVTDSVALREVAYHYEVSVRAGNEQGPVLTTSALAVRLGWPEPPAVYLWASPPAPDNPRAFTLFIYCTWAPLGTRYTLSLMGDAGAVIPLTSYNTTGPQAIGNTTMQLVTGGRDDHLDRQQRYRLHVRLSSGKEAVSTVTLHYRGGAWQTA